MKCKAFLRATIVSSIALITAVASFEARAEEKTYPETLSITVPTATGTIFVIAAGIADLIHKHVPGINVNVEAAAGSGIAANLLKDGRADLALLDEKDVDDAQLGIRMMKDNPYPLKVLGSGHSSVFHVFALKKNNINTLDDMAGRSFAFDKPGSSNRDFGYTLLRLSEIEPPVKVLPWEGTAQACQAVMDETAEVSVTGAIGAPCLRDLFLTHEANLVSIPSETLDALVEAYPGYSRGVIPKGYYDNYGGGTMPAEDWPSIAVRTVLATSPDLPDHVVTAIMQAIYDHPEEMALYHAEANKWTLANGVQIPHAPFHPGAVEYYKSKGLWTPELEAAQEKLLAQQELVQKENQ